MEDADARHGDVPADELAWSETLLVVCRANLIRSPIAAGLLRGHLLSARRTDLSVESVGLQVDRRSAPDADVVRVARQRGVELSGHRPAGASPSAVSRAAMVLTMTEAQRATVARMAPVAVPRIFTLVELVRLTGAADVPPGVSWSDLADRAHRRRPLVAPERAAEDVPDPMGRGTRQLEIVADELVRLCGHVWSGMAPLTAP